VCLGCPSCSPEYDGDAIDDGARYAPNDFSVSYRRARPIPGAGSSRPPASAGGRTCWPARAAPPSSPPGRGTRRPPSRRSPSRSPMGVEERLLRVAEQGRRRLILKHCPRCPRLDGRSETEAVNDRRGCVQDRDERGRRRTSARGQRLSSPPSPPGLHRRSLNGSSFFCFARGFVCRTSSPPPSRGRLTGRGRDGRLRAEREGADGR